jgi:tetraacyldisaccharide 4'-kinase
VLHQLYAAGARYRRRFYAASPDRRRRLGRPVISIGNLAVGGRAKTPLVAAVASRLRALGERPAILSRGYGRRQPEDGVVVVRDADGIRADVDRAGDEPMMLARQLEGVAVLVCSDRFLAGRLAEWQLGCTVHLLDDGFQHFPLHRDVDLVVVDAADLDSPRTLPSGRLREPLDALAAADGIITLDDASVQALGGRLPSWRARRKSGTARLVEPAGATVDVPSGTVVAVAGVARPDRFFADLRAAGWPIAREMTYRDHHVFTRRDVDTIFQTARARGAAMVVTTEKDLVRLLPFRPFPMPVAYLPLAVSIEPAAAFEDWLLAAVRAAREGVS